MRFFIYIIILTTSCGQKRPTSKYKLSKKTENSFYLLGSVNHTKLLKEGFSIKNKKVSSSSSYTAYKISQYSLLSKKENNKSFKETSFKEIWFDKTHPSFNISGGTKNDEAYLNPTQVSGRKLEGYPKFNDLEVDFRIYNQPKAIRFKPVHK